MLFLRSLMITTSWSKTTPAMFGQACVFLFTIVPPFPPVSKTQSTLFISIPSPCLIRLEEGECGKNDEIMLEFFLWQAKHLPYFYPQCQADGIKKGVRRERWIMKFSKHPSIHLIQHVLNACHFSDALPGTGYIHFLPTIFQVRRTQTASVWSQKLPGKEKASSAEWSHCTFTIKWDSRPDKNINLGRKLLKHFKDI